MKKINIWASILLVIALVGFALFNWLIPCSLYSSDSFCSLGVFILSLYGSSFLILISIILFIVGLFIKSKKQSKNLKGAKK